MIVRKGLTSYKIEGLQAKLSLLSDNTSYKKEFIVSKNFTSIRKGGPYIYNRFRNQPFQLLKIKTIRLPTLEEMRLEKEEAKRQKLLQRKSDIDWMFDTACVMNHPKLETKKESIIKMYHMFYDHHPEFTRKHNKDGT